MDNEHIDSRILKNINWTEKTFHDICDKEHSFHFFMDELETDFPFTISCKNHSVEFSVNMLRELEKSFCTFLQEFNGVAKEYNTGDVDIKKEEVHTEKVDVYLTTFVAGINAPQYDRRNAIRLELNYREVKWLHEFILLVLEKYEEISKVKGGNKHEQGK